MTKPTLNRKVQCWIFSRAAGPLIPAGERCLLLKTNDARGAFWQPVTGTVEDDEGYFEAACREPLEETGFEFDGPPVDSGFEFDFTSRFGPARERIYALTVGNVPTPKLDPREHQGFQWLRPDEAIKLLRFPSNVDGLKMTYKLVFGRELGEDPG
ncbi:MAG: NUDIX domain-containing protein [Deltaproteobacteria bacterium]|nr:NUDIX domain-containing protein [Deltaproteobacteria bacterium]